MNCELGLAEPGTRGMLLAQHSEPCTRPSESFTGTPMYAPMLRITDTLRRAGSALVSETMFGISPLSIRAQ